MGVSVIPTFAPYIQTPEVRVKQQPLQTTRTNTAANGYVLGPFDTTEIPSVTVGIEPTPFGGSGLTRPQAELPVLSMVHLKEVPELRMSDHDRWPPLSEPPTLVNEDNLTTATINTASPKGPVLGQSRRSSSNRVPLPLA
ncbi:hypothetical protein CH63R_07077 [Colletotrichum higginsianum IMI 349063]|uniref:Uncharacterized protein n=1 Tax=Colletotrichum higginsianum (strain IMI 349063) TaxID=759273 RepID=A0A1B7Y8G1_COLHI|nr:hypothetical protein CH63R_07077 [Colletotrichum higginsianum IMI 349063]OBR08312.1 hypothetical protein CH63R_07077 [Colletotrichum higginsianum IMI 349063]